eukprot:204883_1
MATATKQPAQYQPQLNVAPDQDDPDTYMMLVPADKKVPILQIIFTGLAVCVIIAALATDEMSDGDVRWDFEETSDDFLDEIDYDCGWQDFRLKFIYYGTQEIQYKYKYTD